jgi:hypothetical protein
LKMGRLEGKVAVITGGASGIGEAAVRLFVEEGASVLVADIQDEKGRCLAKELGAKAIYQHTDVSREADVKAAVELAVKNFAHLDCIFNNAGSARFSGPIEETPFDAFDRPILNPQSASFSRTRCVLSLEILWAVTSVRVRFPSRAFAQDTRSAGLSVRSSQLALGLSEIALSPGCAYTVSAPMQLQLTGLDIGN